MEVPSGTAAHTSVRIEGWHPKGLLPLAVQLQSPLRGGDLTAGSLTCQSLEITRVRRGSAGLTGQVPDSAVSCPSQSVSPYLIFPPHLW